MRLTEQNMQLPRLQPGIATVFAALAFSKSLTGQDIESPISRWEGMTTQFVRCWVANRRHVLTLAVTARQALGDRFCAFQIDGTYNNKIALRKRHFILRCGFQNLVCCWTDLSKLTISVFFWMSQLIKLGK